MYCLFLHLSLHCSCTLSGTNKELCVHCALLDALADIKAAAAAAMATAIAVMGAAGRRLGC